MGGWLADACSGVVGACSGETWVRNDPNGWFVGARSGEAWVRNGPKGCLTLLDVVQHGCQTVLCGCYIDVPC